MRRDTRGFIQSCPTEHMTRIASEARRKAFTLLLRKQRGTGSQRGRTELAYRVLRGE